MERNSRLLRLSVAGLMLVGLAACGQKAGTTQAPPANPAAVEWPSAAGDDDDSVAQMVAKRIHGLDSQAFRVVTVKAVGNTVMLTGAVTKPEQRRRAEQAAKDVSGVAKIHNELLICDEGLFPRFIPDQGREITLGQRLADDPTLKGAKLKLRFVNGVAYVLGSVRSSDDIARVKAALLEDEAVKYVVAELAAP